MMGDWTYGEALFFIRFACFLIAMSKMGYHLKPAEVGLNVNIEPSRIELLKVR